MLKFQQNRRTMENDLNLLQNCPLFRDIRPEEISGMLSCFDALRRRCEKGEIILAEGSPARYLGIVLSGEVQISRVDYFGNRSILAHIGPAGIFGEAFACAAADTLPVDVTAARDAEVLLLNCASLLHPCEKACSFHRQLISNLLQVVAAKNILLNQKIEITAHRSTREKLMAYLLWQAKQADSASFTIPYDRQALADYLEVERSGLSAEIGRLRREGVIACQKNSFTLL